MSPSIHPTSCRSYASAVVTRLAGPVTLSSTRGRPSWSVLCRMNYLSLLLTCRQQLDAGMHPAKDGYAALPFFDEFDLSTVDVLLLSQYVPYPRLRMIIDRQFVLQRAELLPWSSQACLTVHVHQNEWNVLFSFNCVHFSSPSTRSLGWHLDPWHHRRSVS